MEQPVQYTNEAAHASTEPRSNRHPAAETNTRSKGQPAKLKPTQAAMPAR